MKASTWLVLETGRVPRIVGIRQNRPINRMAVHITLEFDENALQPHVETMIDAGLIQLQIDVPEEEETT